MATWEPDDEYDASRDGLGAVIAAVIVIAIVMMVTAAMVLAPNGKASPTDAQVNCALPEMQAVYVGIEEQCIDDYNEMMASTP